MSAGLPLGFGAHALKELGCQSMPLASQHLNRMRTKTGSGGCCNRAEAHLQPALPVLSSGRLGTQQGALAPELDDAPLSHRPWPVQNAPGSLLGI